MSGAKPIKLLEGIALETEETVH